MAIEPVCTPAAVGWYVIVIVQEPNGTMALGQLLVCENGPCTSMPWSLRSVPQYVLVSVTVCAALVVPIFCDEKARLEGVTTAASCKYSIRAHPGSLFGPTLCAAT